MAKPEGMTLYWLDYVVFAGTLLVSLGIGIYHSQAGGKQRTTEEYTLGNRRMGLVPVTLSMMVSYISTISLLGYPAEMYAFGAQFWLGAVGMALGSLLATLIFVPLFYNLKISSINEYLEQRFQSTVVKYLGTFFSIWIQLFYCGNVYYGPSTAIEAVSGFPVWCSILICAIVSVIYTSIGGFKAVIWTDVFQTLIMFAGMVLVMIWGLISVKGFRNVFTMNYEWGRLDIFDFDPDPTKRVNFYGVIFGNCLTFLGVYGYSQAALQRYSSLPTLKLAKWCLLGTIPGAILLKTICCFSGLVIFAYYTSLGCDPLSDGQIANPNQILPYFVVNVIQVPAIPGLFMASLAAASLSSASSALNSAATNMWTDIISAQFPNIKESRKAFCIKIIVVIFGIITTLLSFAISTIGGTVIQIIATFSSSIGGPLASLFFMGAFLPWINSIGVCVGTMFGFAFGLWISLGSYTVKKHWNPLPTTVENCTDPIYLMVNVTALAFNSSSTVLPPITTAPLTGLSRLYMLSFLWMREAVCGVTIAVALITSFLTGMRKPSTIEQRFMHPLVAYYCKLAPSKPQESEYKDGEDEKIVLETEGKV